MTNKTNHRDAATPTSSAPAPVETPTGAALPFPVVGIGASAGGLTAVEAFFTHVPADAGANPAFILVQHLSPDYKSHLTELVQRFTPLPVAEVTDGMMVEPNHVYVIPPDKDLELFHGQLHLMTPSAGHGLRLPIDAFFRSLAQDQRERAICVILSGAGSDGALGVRAVNEAGGMIMAQAPDSAEYASMPQSAIATGLVDFILPPDEMPDALIAFIKHTLTHTERTADTAAEPTDDLLQKIFILLRAQTRHDFSGYKPNTLRRRIERRMAVHRIDTLGDYVRYLQQTPEEVTTLFRELLISVTRFFRDPEAFEALRREVIPPLFVGRHPDDMVRVWVPGCSTGEEAYSLAILISEYARDRHAGVKVTIFATDIDARAIDSARAGVYPANIVADVSPERLERYFRRDGNAYTVKKTLRDMVIFAEQDLLIDPPFSHIDLISCRNLLIYLGAEVQKRIMPVFHYVLNPRGFLFLGASESIGEFTDLFAPIDRKWKIYQRQESATAYRQLVGLQPRLVTGEVIPRPTTAKTSADDGARLRALLEQYLLDSHTPAGVLVNTAGDILFIHGSTGRYLEPAPGTANVNLMRMAREGLRLELITAFHQAVARGEAVRRTGLRIADDERPVTMDLLIAPLPVAPELFAVVFTEVSTGAEPAPARPLVADHDQRIVALERELQAKEEYLQRHVEELTTANEELQSANEEMQSTNEELDTSKEELQSVNEELTTVNTELQRKIDALAHANEDMQNLLASIEVGTVFVDADLRVQRFTPAITDIVHLISGDIGRPLTHLNVNLRQYDRLADDARRVFETLEKQETEVQAADGRWYLMRILPYRTQDNAIAGVVITFVEITQQKALQERVRAMQLDEQAHVYAESIVETIRDPLLVLDAELCVLSANHAFIETFHVNAAETIGKRIYDLGKGQWNIPALRTLLEEILPQQSSFNDFIVRHTFEQIGARTMRLNARELRRVNGEQRMILLDIEDITEQQRSLP